MLYIIHERLKAYIHSEIFQEQADFMPGGGTREHVLNIRQIIEKLREFNKFGYLCFVDYQKAFD